MTARAKSNRKHSVRRFAVGAMFCLACRRRLEEPADQCPHCGFTGADCVTRFPFAAPALDEVIDAVGLLDEAGHKVVRGRVARLRRRCRQVRWCLCLVNLPAETDLRLFGFWMLNSAQSPDDDPEAAAWTVLLLVDAASSSVAVSVGYAVEPFVSDDGWMRAAEEMSASWCGGDPAKALCEFLDAAERELEAAAARVARLLGGSRGGES